MDPSSNNDHNGTHFLLQFLKHELTPPGFSGAPENASGELSFLDQYLIVLDLLFFLIALFGVGRAHGLGFA